VIRTLAALKDLDWELVMMGDGELFGEVKNQVQQLELEDRVSLPGWVSPEKVKQVFLESDILFMPSLSEGLPVVGVQALACGLAFMVSDIAGFADIVVDGENGWRVNNNFPDSGYEEKFSSLLRNLDKIKRFKIKSAERSKTFDIHLIVRAYENIFFEIVSE